MRIAFNLCAGALAALLSQAALAGTYELEITEKSVNFTGSEAKAMAVNDSIPGPLLRFRDGEDITIHVKNSMAVDSSIHWHGLLLPYTQDGVPGISFPGIKPGETFTYRFTAKQSGTYWYHSHSGLQEQQGVYGPLIIEPKGREPFRYDREYVVMLSDWSDEKPETILRNLKADSDYYNNDRPTLGDFFKDVGSKGLGATLKDRREWGEMRMLPSDISDVSGYTFLTNGRTPEQNWTGLFKPGERVRLRFINGAAMTIFDVRIPGLKMTVVQADGNNVQPVPVDEFRIAVAETYDVIVRPTEDRAYTVFAEAMARTGYARATLAPRQGMAETVPDLRPRPRLTMADMAGHAGHEGMDHGGAAMESGESGMAHGGGHGAMSHDGAMKADKKMAHGGGHGGMQHGDGMTMPGMAQGADDPGDYAPGSGLTPRAADGGRVLVYGDLKAMTPYADYRAPDREIELRLTGNMERYTWSINGVKYSDAEPVRLTYGERVRLKFVNETMMTHPMHLHGMWMQLDNGSGRFSPLKHVINVAPGTTIRADVPADAIGEWAFHCHLMYHMASGMFRKVIVEPPRQGS